MSENKPLISVIIPCYNAVAYVDYCMASIVSQTIGIEQLQIILINDASTDSTYEKLCEWEQRFPESIMVITYNRNLRQGGARNIGLNYASGTYLSFVDIDDWLEPDMYEKMVSKALSYDTDMVICNFDRPSSREKVHYAVSGEEVFFDCTNPQTQTLFLSNFRLATVTCRCLFLREMFLTNKIRFPENLFYEDHIMFLLYALAKRAYYIPEFLYHWYLNPHSTTTDNSRPLDRILVHADLYPRLCSSRFSHIRDLVDYNFYDKCFVESALCGAVAANSIELLQYLKGVLLQYVPHITHNPYYLRDLTFPFYSWEILFHPIVEQEICEQSFAQLKQGILYYSKHPQVCLYVEKVSRLRRKLETAPDTVTLDAVLELCRQYYQEEFAMQDATDEFVRQITPLFCAPEANRSSLLALTDRFLITIRTPEP